MYRPIPILFVSILILVATTMPAVGGWIEDGVPVCTAYGSQYYGNIVRLASGDVVIVWCDGRGTTVDIYAQLLDPYGVPMWMEGGVPVCEAENSQERPYVIADGLGGVIVSWDDRRSGDFDIYAQRLDSGGGTMWMPGGVLVCTGVRDQAGVKLVSDDQGGAIITWADGRYSEYDTDIYAQRIDPYGSPLWTPNGVVVCYATGDQTGPEIISDGAGGAVIAWVDVRGGSQDIYAQRINGYGGVHWTTDGVPVCVATGSQQRPMLVTGQYGATLIAWQDVRSGIDSDIYAQLINADGGAGWLTNGVPLCTAAESQLISGAVTDGGGGMIVCWDDWRNVLSDVYAQRITRAGVCRWTADGVAVCAENNGQVAYSIISDDAGGAVIAWEDARDDGGDIYVQRIEGSYGGYYWTYGGVPLCAANEQQQYPLLAPDGGGGAVVFWWDRRSDGVSIDLYANRIDRNGFWGYPCPELTLLEDVPNDQGGRIMLTWNASRIDHWSEAGVQYYSIWRKLPATQAQALLASGAQETAPEKIGPDFEGTAYRFMTAAGAVSAWEWIANTEGHSLSQYSYAAPTLYDWTSLDPGWHWFFVSAHCSPSIYWDSPPGAWYSVDNLAPCPPTYLAGEISHRPAGLLLSWPANDAADLGGYRIYRGTNPDFVPAPGNMLASVCDTLVLDASWTWEAGYYYKAAAVDVHGNESGYALLVPDDVTGAETPKVPEESYLAQNYPNPFNPVTRIAFGLSAPELVSVRIYDVAGRLVRVLAEGRRPAANYVEVWDGRDVSGQEVASGIYFCRLDAGSFSQTRKMILMK